MKSEPNGKKSRGEMVAAVDIGSSKICTLLANVTEEAIQVQGVGIYPARGIEKGLVTDIDLAGESIRASVKRAEQASGEAIDSAYIGITGPNISSESNRGIVAVGRSARTVKAKDVNRVLTAARQVDLPPERRLLHVIPTQYTVDGQPGVKDPVGMHGFRLDVDSHIVTVPESVAENIVKCAHKAGLTVKGLVLQSLACAFVVVHPDEMDAGVVVADIGAGTTGLAAFKDNSVISTSVLPVGGNNITKDLAIGLGIHFDAVEIIKKKYGDLRRRNASDEDDSTEDPYININYDGMGKILKQDLNDIIRARVEEIMKLILSQLPSQRAYLANFPAGLVLTGGTANLPGIELLAQEVTGLPAQVASPRGMTGLADTLCDPAYASTVGLLLCGDKWRRDQDWLKEGMTSRFADTVRSIKHLIPRVKVYRS